VVHLQGMVNASNSPAASIFTLPPGYRPEGTVCFAAPSFDGGGVTYTPGSVDYDRGVG
jgi:hypothetical protein